MRADQPEGTSREAGRDHAGSDADLRELRQQRRDCARDIARAFQSRRGSSPSEDPLLARKILATLEDLSRASQASLAQQASRPHRISPVAAAVETPPAPPVPLHETIGLGFLVCLEDGRTCQDLGRHLEARHGLSPAQYRRRWNLPPGYPMTPPPSHQERVGWRRRLALAARADDAGRTPIIRLADERGPGEAGRARHRHRRGAPAGLRHDGVTARATPDRRSEGPQNDGFRR
jgi:predicted transcriptional regulator